MSERRQPIKRARVTIAVNDCSMGARVDSVIARVICRRPKCVPCDELQSARAMAVRILDLLEGQTIDDSSDVVAMMAVFIALKTECIYSPMTMDRLLKYTRMSLVRLNKLERDVLHAIDWRLYGGGVLPEEDGDVAHAASRLDADNEDVSTE